MLTTRRTLLRNLGTVAAIQPLSNLAPNFAFGMEPIENHNAGPKTAPPSLYILFEGPWIFSHIQNVKPADDILTVRAVATGHKCQFGNWDPTIAASSPGGPTGGITAGTTSELPEKGRWSGTIDPPRTKSFRDVVLKEFKDENAICFDDPSLQVDSPTGSDRVVTLPMPDSVCLGGHLMHATITKTLPNGIAVDSGMQSYVSTVLVYDSQGANAPKLTLLDTAGAQIALNPSQHVIFRLKHDKDCIADTDHIERNFALQLSHVKSSSAPTNLQMGAADVKCDVLNICNISYYEMGIDKNPPAMGPCSSKKGAAALSLHKHGVRMHMTSTDFSNCAGGGMAVGP